jgi:hypothetical protein
MISKKIELVYSFLLNIYIGIVYVLPYHRAKVSISFLKYMESGIYLERVKRFGKDLALMMFVFSGELEYLIRKPTFKDKLKALLIPYTYIDRSKEWLTYINKSKEGLINRERKWIK